MDPCFVIPVGANWQVWANAIFQPANADDHQVNTGIMLATHWVTLNNTNLSRWTETTWRTPLPPEPIEIIK
jgi:hypothetical protein